jgi:hypothetical protein
MNIEITESKLAQFHKLLKYSGLEASVSPKDIKYVAECLVRSNIVNHYSDDLTAAYMAGVENGKHRSEVEIKRLHQENQSLKNVVKELIGNTLKCDEDVES